MSINGRPRRVQAAKLAVEKKAREEARAAELEQERVEYLREKELEKAEDDFMVSDICWERKGSTIP